MSYAMPWKSNVLHYAVASQMSCGMSWCQINVSRYAVASQMSHAMRWPVKCLTLCRGKSNVSPYAMMLSNALRYAVAIKCLKLSQMSCGMTWCQTNVSRYAVAVKCYAVASQMSHAMPWPVKWLMLCHGQSNVWRDAMASQMSDATPWSVKCLTLCRGQSNVWRYAVASQMSNATPWPVKCLTLRRGQSNV